MPASSERTFGKLVFEPQIVMFLGPVIIDLAGSHRPSSVPFHRERNDVG
jgi:hypothetical protein